MLIEGAAVGIKEAAGMSSLAQRPTSDKKWDLRIGFTILSGSNSVRKVVVTYLLRS